MDVRVSHVPAYDDAVCPVCGTVIDSLRVEDQTPLEKLGAKVISPLKYFAEPCHHRVSVVVRSFGERPSVEAFVEES